MTIEWQQFLNMKRSPPITDFMVQRKGTFGKRSGGIESRPSVHILTHGTFPLVAWYHQPPTFRLRGISVHTCWVAGHLHFLSDSPWYVWSRPNKSSFHIQTIFHIQYFNLVKIYNHSRLFSQLIRWVHCNPRCIKPKVKWGTKYTFTSLKTKWIARCYFSSKCRWNKTTHNQGGAGPNSHPYMYSQWHWRETAGKEYMNLSFLS